MTVDKKRALAHYTAELHKLDAWHRRLGRWLARPGFDSADSTTMWVTLTLAIIFTGMAIAAHVIGRACL